MASIIANVHKGFELLLEGNEMPLKNTKLRGDMFIFLF